MRIKTIKRESGCYIKLPEELWKEEVELFPLKEGFFLLAAPLGGQVVKGGIQASPQHGKTEEGGAALKEREAALLRKLSSIRFEKRVPAYLAKALSDEEKEVLKSLQKKGAVALLKSSKYKGGVYNISKGFYGRGAERAMLGEIPSSLEKQLFRDGYAVAADRRVAAALSEKLSRQRFTVSGVKSFDGKYYMVTRSFLSRVRKMLEKEGGEVEPRLLAEKFGGHPDGFKAALKILAEGGEYLEKGEVYIRVE